MQPVGGVLRQRGFRRQSSLVVCAERKLAIERIDERPAVADEFAVIGQVLTIGRKFDRERTFLVDSTIRARKLPVCRDTAVVFLIIFGREWDVTPPQRSGILRGLEQIFSVRSDRVTVIADHQRILHDLRRLEARQVDHGDARIHLIVDEQELPIVVAIGLAERRMVRVTVRDHLFTDAAVIETALRSVRKAPARVGVGGENRDHLEDPHRRHSEHEDLAAASARGEHEVFVVLSEWHEGLERGSNVGGRHLTRRDDCLGIAR